MSPIKERALQILNATIIKAEEFNEAIHSDETKETFQEALDCFDTNNY